MTNQQRSLGSHNRRGLSFIFPGSRSLLSSLVLLCLLTLNPGQSLAQTPNTPAWMNPLQSAGTLHPQNYPDLCLKMNKIPGFDGGVINLWTCDGSNSQIWVLYADDTLRPADYPTFCMNLPEDLVTNSEAPSAVPCDGSNGQKWTGDANHNLHLQGYPGYCLSLYGNQSSAGDQIYLLPCDGSSGQMWNATVAQIIPTPTITPTPTNTPTQTNTPTPTVWIDPLAQGGTLNPQDYLGFCLNLANNQAADGSLINLWTCNGSNGQNWVRYADDTLRPVDYPTFCLTADYTPEQLPSIHLWTCNGDLEQYWASDTNHNLRTRNTPFCLNLQNNAASDGALVNMQLCDGSNGQKWNVTVPGLANTPTPTATATNTPVPPTATATNTPVPPTATLTNTPVPPTATATNTPVPPTATATTTPVPPTATATNTPVPPTATATNTPVPPTATPTNTPVPPTATATNTPVPPTATATNTPVPPTPTPVVDACLTQGLRDDFNRANGGLGSNWAGLTGQSFYKIANQQVDVQLGGPVVWKPTTYGVNQAAFVTLSTLDVNSPSQGLLLKVRGGLIPTSGAITVVYDNLTKTVRVSTLRLGTPAWTVYAHTPATFANGDKLLGCVQADGTVRVYQNSTLLTTVTLNSADQGFFNGKGGKIGLWTVAATNAVFDDFGGGALSSVAGATPGESAVPDEMADDGTEITVAVDFPTDDTATPDADNLVNRFFLPLVTR